MILYVAFGGRINAHSRRSSNNTTPIADLKTVSRNRLRYLLPLQIWARGKVLPRNHKNWVSTQPTLEQLESLSSGHHLAISAVALLNSRMLASFNAGFNGRLAELVTIQSFVLERSPDLLFRGDEPHRTHGDAPPYDPADCGSRLLDLLPVFVSSNIPRICEADRRLDKGTRANTTRRTANAVDKSGRCLQSQGCGQAKGS